MVYLNRELARRPSADASEDARELLAKRQANAGAALLRLDAPDPGIRAALTFGIGQGALALSSNYALSYVGANLSVTPRAASVTPGAKSKGYGEADPALTGTLNGFLAGDGVTASYSRTSMIPARKTRIRLLRDLAWWAAGQDEHFQRFEFIRSKRNEPRDEMACGVPLATTEPCPSCRARSEVS